MKENPIVGAGTPLHAWQTSQKLAAVPAISVATLVPAHCRAVIIAPHPDDEVLGCGGLLTQLAQLGRDIKLISVTDGCASHPGSAQWPAERLSVVRPQESAEALRRLHLPVETLEWLRAEFDDTAVGAREEALQALLTEHLRADDVVFTTWSEDGHGDHEAVGRASIRAARAVGATLHEVPIWAWHWAFPEDERLPWARARKVLLDPQSLIRKRYAIQAFSSQLESDPVAGLAPVLPLSALERLTQPFELVFL
jgi:LmbE family N-acetylglucosaminyl deacetylase